MELFRVAVLSVLVLFLIAPTQTVLCERLGKLGPHRNRRLPYDTSFLWRRLLEHKDLNGDARDGDKNGEFLSEKRTLSEHKDVKGDVTPDGHKDGGFLAEKLQKNAKFEVETATAEKELVSNHKRDAQSDTIGIKEKTVKVDQKRDGIHKAQGRGKKKGRGELKIQAKKMSEPSESKQTSDYLSHDEVLQNKTVKEGDRRFKLNSQSENRKEQVMKVEGQPMEKDMITKELESKKTPKKAPLDEQGDAGVVKEDGDEQLTVAPALLEEEESKIESKIGGSVTEAHSDERAKEKKDIEEILKQENKGKGLEVKEREDTEESLKEENEGKEVEVNEREAIEENLKTYTEEDTEGRERGSQEGRKVYGEQEVKGRGDREESLEEENGGEELEEGTVLNGTVAMEGELEESGILGDQGQKMEETSQNLEKEGDTLDSVEEQSEMKEKVMEIKIHSEKQESEDEVKGEFEILGDKERKMQETRKNLDKEGDPSDVADKQSENDGKELEVKVQAEEIKGTLSTPGDDVDDDDYDYGYGVFFQDFADLPSKLHETASKVVGHLVPDIQKVTNTSKDYLNRASEHITESFSPIVGTQNAPFVASIISCGFFILPLAIVAILFERLRALFSLQKVLLFVHIYLAAYFATLMLATFIIGSEPMAFFYKNSTRGFIHLQLLQALAYIVYLILQTLNVSSACSPQPFGIKVALVLQWVVALMVGLHYYVTVFHRAMVMKGPHTSWRVYAIYSVLFTMLCLLSNIKWAKKEYSHSGGVDLNKRN